MVEKLLELDPAKAKGIVHFLLSSRNAELAGDSLLLRLIPAIQPYLVDLRVSSSFPSVSAGMEEFQGILP